MIKQQLCECHPEAKPCECHPEHSEGSCSLRDGKILHYVQDDKKTLFIAMTNGVLGIMQNSNR